MEENSESLTALEGLFQSYKDLCGLASLIELRIRMLANKTKEITDTAFSYKLEDVEEAIFGSTSLGNYFIEEDRKTIRITRKVRNKMLHGELDEAIRLLGEFSGTKLPTSGITIMDANTFLNAFKKGKVEEVIKTAAPAESMGKDVGLFGLLLICGGNGAFVECGKLFEKAENLVHAVTLKSAKSAN